MGNLQRTRLSNSTWRWKRNNWSNNWSSPVIFLMSCSLFLASFLVIIWYVSFPRLLSFTPLCYRSIPRICLSSASPISTPCLGQFWKPGAFLVRQLIPKHWILSIRVYTHGWRTKRTGTYVYMVYIYTRRDTYIYIHIYIYIWYPKAFSANWSPPFANWSFPTQFDDHARQVCAEILRCSSGRQIIGLLTSLVFFVGRWPPGSWQKPKLLAGNIPIVCSPSMLHNVDTQPLYDSASATTKFRKHVVRSWESSPRLW